MSKYIRKMAIGLSSLLISISALATTFSNVISETQHHQLNGLKAGISLKDYCNKIGKGAISIYMDKTTKQKLAQCYDSTNFPDDRNPVLFCCTGLNAMSNKQAWILIEDKFDRKCSGTLFSNNCKESSSVLNP